MNIQVNPSEGAVAMSDLKIAIILGSTRPGRNGKAVADWLLTQAERRTDASYELIDLLDYPLPHLDEAALKQVRVGQPVAA
jgi:NAD(P)H-dependent FMN reductase